MSEKRMTTGACEVAGLEALDHLVQVDLAPASMSGRTTTWPCGIDREVALAPGLDLIQVEGLLDLPGGLAGSIFAGGVHVARTITN
jgi:hypothetical protein